jgi:glucose dehydrogenase
MRVGFLRAAASRLLSTGVLSEGWYSILTGLALLFVAYLLGSVPVNDDPAALFVAIVLFVTGVWQLERGLRAEFQRRPKPPNELS